MRLQTPLLVLVVVGICLPFFFPLWERKVEKDGYNHVRVLTLLSYTSFKHPSEQPQQKESVYQRPVEYLSLPYLGLLCALSFAAAIATLLLYRQRPAQMKLCRINFWALVATLIACFHYVTQLEEHLQPPTGTYTWGSYGIVGALLLNWIASILIRRDERLVRDADTLR